MKMCVKHKKEFVLEEYLTYGGNFIKYNTKASNYDIVRPLKETANHQYYAAWKQGLANPRIYRNQKKVDRIWRDSVRINMLKVEKE